MIRIKGFCIVVLSADDLDSAVAQDLLREDAEHVRDDLVSHPVGREDAYWHRTVSVVKRFGLLREGFSGQTSLVLVASVRRWSGLRAYPRRAKETQKEKQFQNLHRRTAHVFPRKTFYTKSKRYKLCTYFPRMTSRHILSNDLYSSSLMDPGVILYVCNEKSEKSSFENSPKKRDKVLRSGLNLLFFPPCLLSFRKVTSDWKCVRVSFSLLYICGLSRLFSHSFVSKAPFFQTPGSRFVQAEDGETDVWNRRRRRRLLHYN